MFIFIVVGSGDNGCVVVVKILEGLTRDFFVELGNFSMLFFLKK